MIDWDHLDVLQDQMGCDGVREIVDLFVEETACVVENLDNAGSRTLDDLHFIKGSASNLGLRQLSQICRAAELAVRSGEPYDSDEVRASFDRSCEALFARFREAA